MPVSILGQNLANSFKQLVSRERHSVRHAWYLLRLLVIVALIDANGISLENAITSSIAEMSQGSMEIPCHRKRLSFAVTRAGIFVVTPGVGQSLKAGLVRKSNLQ